MMLQVKETVTPVIRDPGGHVSQIENLIINATERSDAYNTGNTTGGPAGIDDAIVDRLFRILVHTKNVHGDRHQPISKLFGKCFDCTFRPLPEELYVFLIVHTNPSSLM